MVETLEESEHARILLWWRAILTGIALSPGMNAGWPWVLDLFGGDLVVSTFGESGMNEGPADADLVMHAQLTTADGHTIMGADTPSSMPQPTGTQQVSLSGDDAATLLILLTWIAMRGMSAAAA